MIYFSKNPQLEALQRVCNKRHARAIQGGLTEKKAASIVLDYIKKWAEKWTGKDRPLRNKEISDALLSAYSVEL